MIEDNFEACRLGAAGSSEGWNSDDTASFDPRVLLQRSSVFNPFTRYDQEPRTRAVAVPADAWGVVPLYVPSSKKQAHGKFRK